VESAKKRDAPHSKAAPPEKGNKRHYQLGYKNLFLPCLPVKKRKPEGYFDKGKNSPELH